MSHRLPPPGNAPLITLPTLVVALQTSGGDEGCDGLVQFCAVAMQGSAALDEPRINRRFAPPIALGADAGGHLAQWLTELEAQSAGRVVIGHAIAPTLLAIRHAAQQAGHSWREPPVLDLIHLAGVLDPAPTDPSLASLAARLDVAVAGDDPLWSECLTIAKIWGKLLALLREADIRTFGEARGFAEQRAAAASYDSEADWYDGGAAARRPERPPLLTTRIDGYVFQRRLRDLMSAPPVMIAARATLREAAQTMCERRIGALLVGAADTPPEGIVTERDLLQVAARYGADLDATTVAAVMNSPVESMAGNEMLYRALARMDRLGIRHLCVVDTAGVAVGMLSQRNLLQHRARGAEMLGDAIARADDTAALNAAYAEVPTVASRLVDEGLDGLTIARFLSGELRALTARAAELAVQDLAARGPGPAPAPWCLLVLGSGGRGESLLGTDQDNALVHAGRDADDAWFAALGDGIAERLDQAGVPRCSGGVMAATAQWRGTEAQWSQRIAAWVRRARPEDLLNVDIFFDLVPVAGTASLSRRVHREAVRAASTTLPFLGLLAESVNAVAPRLGFMGNLPAAEGRIDLKRDGLLPLVSLARTLALRVASTARATPERLRDAVAAGRLPDGDAAALIELHAELLTLIVHQQLADLDAGLAPSSRVELKALSREQRSRLKHRLKHLDTVVKELRGAIAG